MAMVEKDWNFKNVSQRYLVWTRYILKNLHFNTFTFSWQNSFGVFILVCNGNRCLLIKYQVSFSTRDDLKTSKLPWQCPIKKKKREKQSKQHTVTKLLYSSGIGVIAIASSIRHALVMSTIGMLHMGQAYPLQSKVQRFVVVCCSRRTEGLRGI